MARPRRRRRRDAALALAALVLALPFCLDLGRRRPARASSAPTDAVAWRRRWDGALAAFNRRRGSAGKECAELTAFIPAFHRSVDEFIFNIF